MIAALVVVSGHFVSQVAKICFAMRILGENESEILSRGIAYLVRAQQASGLWTASERSIVTSCFCLAALQPQLPQGFGPYDSDIGVVLGSHVKCVKRSVCVLSCVAPI